MQIDQPNDLGDALINTVAADNLVDVSASILDATAIATLEVGAEVWENFPIIGPLFKFYKVGAAVHQQIFINKLRLFLSELGKIPVAKRIEFVTKLNEDARFRHKVGENLIQLIDRLDDIDKASFLAQLLAFQVDGKIDYDMFRRLAAVLDKIFMPDLLEFISIDILDSQGSDGGGFVIPQEQDILTQGLLASGVVDRPVNIIRDLQNSPNNYMYIDTQVSFTVVGRTLRKLFKYGS